MEIKISVLEKVCFSETKNENERNETINNEMNEIEPIIEYNITSENNNTPNNNNNVNKK